MRQFLARSHKTYWLPSPAIEPSRTAELPVRSQISRETSGVSRVSSGRFIKRSDFLMLSSETRVRNGDCCSCTAQPLPKRLVKDRIACLVLKFAKNNRVLCREFRRPVKVKIGRGGQRQNRRGGDGHARAVPRRSDRRQFPLQLGRRLPPSCGVVFQAPGDDVFQLSRPDALRCGPSRAPVNISKRTRPNA